MRTVAALAIISILSSLTLAQQPNRPNVVVIFSDDHAAHAVSTYGSTINSTPNIDRIGRDGVKLTNSFVTNSLCAPSRATLLTGKYAHKHNYPDNARGRLFDGSQVTLPKLLQAGGYETAVFGKWHLRSDPTGFDRWLVIDGVASYFSPNFKDASGTRKIEGYATDTIFTQSIDYLRSRKAGDKPFFLLVTPNAPHRNWTSDDAHKNLFADTEIPEPATFNDDYTTRTTAARECHMSILDDLRKNDVKADIPTNLSAAELKKWKYQRFAKDYLRCVAAMDDGIGRLLDELDRSGLAQSTLVIYTSDNGFFLGDHGWFDKRFMYEQSIRVPLVARLPGAIAAGSTVDAMTLNIDTAPTILDFASVAVPKEMQGESWKPLVQSAVATEHQARPAWRTEMYYHYYEQEAEHNVAPHYGVRTATHKLIYFPTHKEWELYDLVRDPDELSNIFGKSTYAEIQASLLRSLQALRQQYDVTPD